MANFADRLLDAVDAKGTPLIVGLDPTYENLPPSLTTHLGPQPDVDQAIDAILEFCTKVIKVVAPHVPAVKINSAFFETYYGEGAEAYMILVQEAAAAGLLVIGDVKRADIGNTTAAYAAACLAAPKFRSLKDLPAPDAVTVNPYLGLDGIKPFADVAQKEGKGVFVLVRTSNAAAAEIQDRKLDTGETVYMHVGKLVEKWGEGLIGQRGYSSVGAVVGATNPQQMVELRKAFPKMLFLVPGFGTQGGTAADAAKAFNPDGRGAVINASRSILYAHKDEKYKSFAKENWEKAVEQATLDAKAQIAAALVG